MLRLACVNLPDFALQLLIRQHPQWRNQPAVLVRDHKPTAFVLASNPAARALRITPGIRYAAALSQFPGLQAGVVDSSSIAAGTDRLLHHLRRWSPDIEPAAEIPGVFWLDASGLGSMFGSLAGWGRQVRTSLEEQGFQATLTIGFHKLYSYAASCTRTSSHLFRSPAAEAAAAGRARIHQLGLPFTPAERNLLQDLGLHTLDDLRGIPADELDRRLGTSIEELHALLTGRRTSPLQPAPWPKPCTHTCQWPGGENNRSGMAFRLQQPLAALVTQLARQGQRLVHLQVTLHFDHSRPLQLEIEPAQATGDVPRLLELLRLHLERTELPEAASSCRLDARGDMVRSGQFSLFALPPGRSLQAAAESMDRLRARWGNDAVVRAVEDDAWLPEDRFHWEQCQNITLPDLPATVAAGTAVRRCATRPVALDLPAPAPAMVHQPGRHALATPHGSWILEGPQWQQHSWWADDSWQNRLYYRAQNPRHACLWIFWDVRQRQWFLQACLS